MERATGDFLCRFITGIGAAGLIRQEAILTFNFVFFAFDERLVRKAL